MNLEAPTGEATALLAGVPTAPLFSPAGVEAPGVEDPAPLAGIPALVPPVLSLDVAEGMVWGSILGELPGAIVAGIPEGGIA